MATRDDILVFDPEGDVRYWTGEGFGGFAYLNGWQLVGVGSFG